jgi:hypothetical protein
MSYRLFAFPKRGKVQVVVVVVAAAAAVVVAAEAAVVVVAAVAVAMAVVFVIAAATMVLICLNRVIFTKLGIKVMPLKDTPASFSYTFSNNMTKARTCEVGTALASRTPFPGNVFEKVNNKLGAVRISSSSFSFVAVT